jgi:D-beta-D-heptose 7-phosphate kinase/D-beta-D-heptose 1-phosphate adenosyltransferase
MSEKICSAEEILLKLVKWRSGSEKIVFTNGCFDLLHVGHVSYLEQAKKHGDYLIVGLNTDRSVRELKGPKRPVISELDRARVISALATVDAVVLFDELTPVRLIRAISPDVLVKGADYTEDQVVGGDVVKERGGRVVIVPLMTGKSSSAIINDIDRG